MKREANTISIARALPGNRGWLKIALPILTLSFLSAMACDNPIVKEKKADVRMFVFPSHGVKRPVGGTFEMGIDTAYYNVTVGTIRVTIDTSNAQFLTPVEEGDVKDSYPENTKSFFFEEFGPPTVYSFAHEQADMGGALVIQRVHFECIDVGQGSVDVSAEFEVEGGGSKILTDSLPVECTPCIEDLIEDWVDSILSAVVSFAAPWIDITCFAGNVDTLSVDETDAYYNESIYECGAADDQLRVVCPADVEDMPAGDVVVITTLLDEPIPDSDDEHSYIYSVVFDSDGDPANDWQFQMPWDGDYFQGADRWYQCIYNHATDTWSVTVTQVSTGQSTSQVSSTARAIIEDNRITWHISKSELPADTIRYRVTAFGHDGAYSETDRGGDVSGVDATEPLTEL